MNNRPRFTAPALLSHSRERGFSLHAIKEELNERISKDDSKNKAQNIPGFQINFVTNTNAKILISAIIVVALLCSTIVTVAYSANQDLKANAADIQQLKSIKHTPVINVSDPVVLKK
ncbi:hypothetical protein BH11BAC7_BH11BAC7_25130 [soil metagenome]